MTTPQTIPTRTVSHQPTMKRFTPKSGPDFYPTPYWVARALCDVEAFTGTIWEPACGNGVMAKALATTGQPVISTDLHDYGWGESGVDFLTASRAADNIVTNPPFNQAEAFLDHALKIATGKVCLLLRSAFAEGAGRHRSIFSCRPPARIWQLSERATFYPHGVQTAGSGTMSYSWFVWERGYEGPTIFGWIQPGAKAKYGSEVSA